jgi:hypothetical protein
MTTVSDLIEMLGIFPDEMEVLINVFEVDGEARVATLNVTENEIMVPVYTQEVVGVQS